MSSRFTRTRVASSSRPPMSCASARPTRAPRRSSRSWRQRCRSRSSRHSLPRGCGRPGARPGRNPHRHPSPEERRNRSGERSEALAPRNRRDVRTRGGGTEALGVAVGPRRGGVARTSSSRRRGIRKRSARAWGSSRQKASQCRVWYGEKPVTLPLGAEFHRRRLEIRSSQVSTIGSRAIRWEAPEDRGDTGTARGASTRSPRLAHLPLERAPEAYAALDRGDDGVVHVALAYS